MSTTTGRFTQAASSLTASTRDRLWFRLSVKRREVITITDKSVPFDWLSYDWRSRVLTAQFASGGRYRYEGVPHREARFFLSTRYKGRFFNQRIRNVYPAWKMA